MTEYTLFTSPSKVTVEQEQRTSPVLQPILNSLASSSDDKSMQTTHSRKPVNNTASFLVENENARWLAKRPLLRAFLYHTLQLLSVIEFHDMDSYIRELQKSIEDCMGSHRYRRALAGVNHGRHLSVSPQTQHDGQSLATSSNASIQLVINELNDRTAAFGGRFIWEESDVKRDDPTFRSLFRELAEKTNPGGTMLRAEAKQERLYDGYCTLRVRTQRASIANSFVSIADSNSTNNSVDDVHKVAKFFDLFAINYFTSDSFFDDSHRHSYPGRNTLVDVDGKQKRLFRPQPRQKDLTQLEFPGEEVHKPHYLAALTHYQSHQGHQPVSLADMQHEDLTVSIADSLVLSQQTEQLSSHGEHILNSFSMPVLNTDNKPHHQHFPQEERHSHSTSQLSSLHSSAKKLSPSKAGQTARLMLQLKN